MSDPKLPDWITEHLNSYLATDGEEGHIWRGMTCLLLTTVGKSSGRTRTLPLIYGMPGESAVIVASKGGAPKHPSWYDNLVANPEVQVQIKGDKFAARARTAAGEEREELWKHMTGIFPTYDEYKDKAAPREIPVVVLDRQE